MTVINSLTVNAGELSVAWSKMWFGAICGDGKNWVYRNYDLYISYSPAQWRILLLFHGAIHASATQSIHIFCSQFLPLPIWDCTFRFSVCARQLLSSLLRYYDLTSRLLKKSDMNGMWLFFCFFNVLYIWYIYALWHPFLYMYVPAVHSTVSSIQINKQHA